MEKQLRQVDENGMVWWKDRDLLGGRGGGSETKKSGGENSKEDKERDSAVDNYMLTQKWQQRPMPVEDGVIGLGISMTDPRAMTNGRSVEVVDEQLDHADDLGVRVTVSGKERQREPTETKRGERVFLGRKEEGKRAERPTQSETSQRSVFRMAEVREAAPEARRIWERKGRNNPPGRIITTL